MTTCHFFVTRNNNCLFSHVLSFLSLWGRRNNQRAFIHPMFMSSQCQRCFLMSRSEASPCLSFVCFQISWHNAISLHTICYTTLICTSTKNNDISNKLFDGDISLSYTTSISSSLIHFQISCPWNKRWPFCFNLSTTFRQARWYSPILIFLMDALLVPLKGQAQLTSLLSKC